MARVPLSNENEKINKPASKCNNQEKQINHRNYAVTLV
jgi:hypothetical protein